MPSTCLAEITANQLHQNVRTGLTPASPAARQPQRQWAQVRLDAQNCDSEDQDLKDFVGGAQDIARDAA
jgi:hypothetical protein